MLTPAFALKFISGKYQGGEFPLRADREIVVGRASDLDMVLVEDMVSRKHAKFVATREAVTIADLGSTNGTFVNGEKIKEVTLKEGDRILIGTSIIKVVTVDATASVSETEARQNLAATGARQKAANKPMSGSIDEIPLPDLLQLLSTSRKTGSLAVRGDDVGRIFLRKGQIYYAAIERLKLPPRKAAFRMLTWTSGTFELEPAGEEQTFPDELADSTEGLLMEGMRQLDEYQVLAPGLPAPGAALALAQPLQPRLRDLDENELDVLQLVMAHGRLQAVLDRSTESDLDTAKALTSLLKRGYVTASARSGGGDIPPRS